MNVSKRDIALFSKLSDLQNIESLPITLKIGNEKYAGLPKGSEPTVEKRRIDADIFYTKAKASLGSGLEITVESNEYRDCNVIEWVAYIENKSDKDSEIISDFKICGNIKGDDPFLYHCNGDTKKEDGYEWYTDEITEEGLKIYPCNDGTSCNGAFPYMRILSGGFGINAAIGWSATWEADFTKEKDGIVFSAFQKNLKTYLKPGEKIRTPSLTLQIFKGGNDRGRNLWRSFYFKHILPRENGKPLSPKLVLHTFMVDGLPEFCGASEINQINAINAYIEKGLKPDIWWIDAGWYPCDNDWTKTGTWRPNPEHFPNGLTPIGKLCEEKKIDFLLWFEPERVRKGSELYENHPDHLLYYKRNDNGWYMENALLDLSKKEVCDALIEMTDRIIKENKIKIYRQDFNFDPMPYWEDNSEKDRIGILENLHIQGYYRYWDTLIERNPGLLIDSCASGGRRNDIETMKRAVPLHYTDVGYGNHPIKQKQHVTMFEWIPYFRAHTFSWDSDDGTYTGNKPVDEFAYQNAITPAITSTIEWNDSPEKFKLGKKYEKIWRKCAKIELSCDFYPLTECRKDPKDYYSIQFDGKSRGFIQIIRNINVTEDSVKVYPHADINKNYIFTDETGNRSFTISGKELSENGFTDSLPKRSGIIWFYKKTAGKER